MRRRRLHFSPLTGRGLVVASQEAWHTWHALAELHPFDCFPLDTMTERMNEHHARYPEVAQVAKRLMDLEDAIAERIDR